MDAAASKPLKVDFGQILGHTGLLIVLYEIFRDGVKGRYARDGVMGEPLLHPCLVRAGPFCGEVRIANRRAETIEVAQRGEADVPLVIYLQSGVVEDVVVGSLEQAVTLGLLLLPVLPVVAVARHETQAFQRGDFVFDAGGINVVSLARVRRAERVGGHVNESAVHPAVPFDGQGEGDDACLAQVVLGLEGGTFDAGIDVLTKGALNEVEGVELAVVVEVVLLIALVEKGPSPYAEVPRDVVVGGKLEGEGIEIVYPLVFRGGGKGVEGLVEYAARFAERSIGVGDREPRFRSSFGVKPALPKRLFLWMSLLFR